MEPVEIVVRDDVPTTGYWRRGAFVINGSIDAGDPLYWVCTFSGEPGTWQPVYPTSPQEGAGDGETEAVTVTEEGNTVMHKTTFTFTDLQVELTDDAGNGQWGTVPLYTAPEGNVVVLGATADLELELSQAYWADDATGTFGLGTAASEDASTLETTLQDILPVTNIAALTDQAGPVTGQSDGVFVSGAAGGDAMAINLNLVVADDSAHMPTIVTNGTFTGNATGWTLGAGWAYGTNDVAATTASTALSQAVTLEVGVPYTLTYTTTRSAGSVTPTLGGVAGTARSTADTFVETITPTSASGLSFTGTGFTGTIDSVTCVPQLGHGVLNGTVTVVWTNTGNF